MLLEPESLRAALAERISSRAFRLEPVGFRVERLERVARPAVQAQSVRRAALQVAQSYFHAYWEVFREQAPVAQRGLRAVPLECAHPDELQELVALVARRAVPLALVRRDEPPPVRQVGYRWPGLPAACSEEHRDRPVRAVEFRWLADPVYLQMRAAQVWHWVLADPVVQPTLVGLVVRRVMSQRFHLAVQGVLQLASPRVVELF